MVKKRKKVKHKKKSSTVQKSASTLQLKRESDIAMDFATKVYKEFNKIVKSIILFGSTAKHESVVGSDIDIIILIDDASIKWDQELIAWYRTELDKILRANPYQKNLHVNTVKLTTWWEDLVSGDPVVLNIIRHGEAIIDLAGFFEPLKALLVMGKLKSTPEAVYAALQRAPMHIARSKSYELSAVEGLFWAMVDSSHAALIAAGIPPASPEHIPIDLKENFVDTKKLKSDYVNWYRELFMIHKKIIHGDIKELKGIEVDAWRDKTEDFLKTMANLVKELID